MHAVMRNDEKASIEIALRANQQQSQPNTGFNGLYVDGENSNAQPWQQDCNGMKETGRASLNRFQRLPSFSSSAGLARRSMATK